MRQDEYDEPWPIPPAFAVTKLACIATTLAPISAMACGGAARFYTSNHYMLPDLFGNIRPTRSRVDAGEDRGIGQRDGRDPQRRHRGHHDDDAAGLSASGEASLFPAFDWISDVLQIKWTSMDMYQVPDKLSRAIELYTPWTIDITVAWAHRPGPKVFIPLHWALICSCRRSSSPSSTGRVSRRRCLA